MAVVVVGWPLLTPFVTLLLRGPASLSPHLSLSFYRSVLLSARPSTHPQICTPTYSTFETLATYQGFAPGASVLRVWMTHPHRVYLPYVHAFHAIKRTSFF